MGQLPALWFKNKKAFVTGGTSGIGLEMAKLLVSWECSVIVSGRDEKRLSRALDCLNSIRPHSASGLTADLSTSAGRNQTIQHLKEHGPIDLLINNAGFGVMEPFASMPASQISDMIETNITAVTELTYALIPLMKGRAGCGILNLGSVASFFPTPGSALYGATKFFIRGFSDALHAELKPLGIHVTGLFPGKTLTGFLARATTGKCAQWQAAMQPGVVAQAGLGGLMNNRLHVVCSLTDRIMILASSWLPTEILLSLTGSRISSEIKK